MAELPDEVVELLMTYAVMSRHPAYLRLGSNGQLLEAGGHVQRYHLDQLEVGQPAEHQVCFLDGLVPATEPHVHLPLLDIGVGRIVDVHIIRQSKCHWILLLDATLEADDRQSIQQRVNEQELRDGP